MRRVRYSVAMSLDGHIAGVNEEYDWIIMDPAIDFAAFFKGFDTVLMGRRTFEVAIRQGTGGKMPGMQSFVFSKTLRPADYPGITIVAAGTEETVARLKAAAGKDIWLMGGGVLFRSLLDANLVDTVEVGVIPILLGQGIPVVHPGPGSASLRLTDSRTLPSGIVMLSYTVQYGDAQHAAQADGPTRPGLGKRRKARTGPARRLASTRLSRTAMREEKS